MVRTRVYCYATEDKVRFYDEAIRLQPDFAEAFTLRGAARNATGDVEGVLKTYAFWSENQLHQDDLVR